MGAMPRCMTRRLIYSPQTLQISNKILTTLPVGLPRKHHHIARHQAGRTGQPLVQIGVVPLQAGALQGGGIGKGWSLGTGAIEYAVQARPNQVLARFGAVAEAAPRLEQGLGLRD